MAQISFSAARRVHGKTDLAKNGMSCSSALWHGRRVARATFTSLASFNWTNGANPDLVSLAQGVDGNLYGTTRYGGDSYGNGTIFRVSTTGAITVVDVLNGYGFYPFGGLVLGTGGNLYGTTSEGGPSGWGSVFEVTPAGTVQGLTVFNSFDGGYPTGTFDYRLQRRRRRNADNAARLRRHRRFHSIRRPR